MANHIQETLTNAVAELAAGSGCHTIEAVSTIRRNPEANAPRVYLTVIVTNDAGTGFCQNTVRLRRPRRPSEQSALAQKRMLDHEIAARGLTPRPDSENSD